MLKKILFTCFTIFSASLAYSATSAVQPVNYSVTLANDISITGTASLDITSASPEVGGIYSEIDALTTYDLTIVAPALTDTQIIAKMDFSFSGTEVLKLQAASPAISGIETTPQITLTTIDQMLISNIFGATGTATAKTLTYTFEAQVGDNGSSGTKNVTLSILQS